MAKHKAHTKSATGVVGDPNAIAAILGQNNVSQYVKEAELVGGYLESSLGRSVNEKGGGGGVGLFQLTGKGAKVEAEAVDPVFSVKYMRGAYEAAVKKVGVKAFKTHPAQAAERAAYLAERPKYDYYTTDGATKVANAFSNALEASVAYSSGQIKANSTMYGKGTIGTVTSPGKAAATRLWNAGIRGHDLVIALSVIGAETKGTYRNSDVSTIINNYKQDKSFKGEAGYDNGAYINYLGNALLDLKAVGHKTNFAFTSSDPGNNAAKAGFFSGLGTAYKNEGKAALDAVDSVPKLIEWFTSVDHLIRVAFFLVGLALILIGATKLTGGATPVPVPLPV